MIAISKSRQAAESIVPREVSSLIEKAFFGGESETGDSQIHAAFRYHFGCPGGGARMKLTLQCASLLDINDRIACQLAAAVECLHNASLIQDDVQDRSGTRRGQPTVAASFGTDVALGLTNRLVSAAFVCVTQDSLTPHIGDLVRKLHQAISETIEGQTKELCSGAANRSVRERMQASASKSGPLFGLALELPLIVAGYHEYLETGRQAALRFGLGYQILDDLDDCETDARQGADGNLVLAMQSESAAMDENAAVRAGALARSILQEASALAAVIPCDAGRPLIRLVEKLLLSIDGTNQ